MANFMRLPKGGDLATEGWDGAAADSYFSGLLIKIVDYGEAVIVGTYVEKG